MRFRYEGVTFPKGNDPGQVNFNAINTGSPLLIGNFAPVFDTDQDRTLFRFRTRLGLDADLDYGITAGLRFATGDTAAPVSTNATFGSNGGDFSKYAVWLDRAFLKFQDQNDTLNLSVGRFDNPFWQATDLVWYSELGFDGIAAKAKYEVSPGLTPFVVAGAFPIFNTALNAAYAIETDGGDSGFPSELPSTDKYLFGGQLGVNERFSPDYNLRVAAAYYDFTNVQGQVSLPCQVASASDVCSTDLTRPSYAQNGNTYIALRNIVFVPGTVNDYQFFGLASQFRPVVASAELDFANFNPIHVVLDGEYVRNLGFDKNAIIASGSPTNPGPANNTGPTNVPGTSGPYEGGDQGFMARLTVGDTKIQHLWDWNAHVAYKYLESDAVMDAFTDPDFGLGGTNLKGFIVGANLGIAENVSTSVRWMSANNVAGIPYAVDVLLVDLNAKF
jgi:hypothetical protein